jgi:hypothetical protein
LLDYLVHCPQLLWPTFLLLLLLLLNLWALPQVLRHHLNCSLPVEIAHRGDLSGHIQQPSSMLRAVDRLSQLLLLLLLLLLLVDLWASPQVLRHHLNCSLPVEIAYRGDSEVDSVTRASLSAAFQPLHWLDMDKQPYPQHHNK